MRELRKAKTIVAILFAIALVGCAKAQKGSGEEKTSEGTRATSAIGKYYEVVRAGDAKKVAAILKGGIAVDALWDDAETDEMMKDLTTLMITAKNGREVMAKMLIDAGANVNARGYGGITALMIASGVGNTEVAKVLLEGGADASLKDESGSQALGMAAEKGQSETVILLIEHGAPIDELQGNGGTSLMAAVQSGNVEVVKDLLEAKARVDIIAKPTDVTALMLAAWKGEPAVVEMLLKYGADVNQPSINGMTALAAAVQENKPEIVQLLIDHGAKVNVEYKNTETKERLTPLIVAASDGNNELIKILVKHGARVSDRTNDDGYIALYAASQKGQFDTVELLINLGSEINAKNKFGATAIMFAASDNHPDIVKLLLDKGAKYEYVTTNGLTPLFSAVDGDSYDSAKYLLEAGSNPNIKAKLDGKTYTNLGYAKARGFNDIAELLVKYGAKE